MFLDRPPDFSATPLENEDGHRKLLPKTTGPHRVKNATTDTLTIDRNGLLDTVSIKRVSKAPQPPLARVPPPIASSTIRAPPPTRTNPAVQRTQTTVSVDPESQVPVDLYSAELEADMEYAIERVVAHGETEAGTPIYHVRWYGYGPEDDTWEPAENLPAKFIRRYRARR